MTQYVPAEWLSPKSLVGVTGPAYFRAATDDGGVFFVTGGEDPQAIFLSGERFGKSLRAKAGSGRGGFVVGEVRIEIDPQSIYNPDRDGFRPCAVGMIESGLYVFAASRGGYGFEDPLSWNVATGEGREFLTGSIGFTRWRICKGVGDSSVTIMDVDALAARPA